MSYFHSDTNALREEREESLFEGGGGRLIDRGLVQPEQIDPSMTGMAAAVDEADFTQLNSSYSYQLSNNTCLFQ